MKVPLSNLNAPSRVIKRAQYEAFEFTLEDGGVRVRNGSHANPDDHEYLVTVDGETPTACECPADAHYEGACKHRVAVAIRRPVLDAAIDRQLATDGGKPRTPPETSRNDQGVSSLGPDRSTTDGSSPTADSGEDDENDRSEIECVCAELPDRVPCWECVRTGRREVPGSESTR